MYLCPHLFSDGWWPSLMVSYMVKLEVAVKVLQCADICSSYRNCGSKTEEVRKSEKQCWDLVLAEISGTGS